MRHRRAIALAACLALLSAFLVGEVLVGGELMMGRDQLGYEYPRLKVISDALARGEVPRWNPYMYHGSPLLGPRAGGVLYPGYLLFAFLPLAFARGLFVALHLVLAMEGMRRFARLDSGPTASLVTGFLFGLGGWVVSMYWGPYLISSALLPWACLGGALIPKDPLRGFACSASALGLILLATEPQGAVIAAAGLGLTAFARCPDPSARRRVAGVALLAIVIAAAAGGLTVLSVLDETPRTNRALAGYDDTLFTFSLSGAALDFFARGISGDWGADIDAYWAWPLYDDWVPWGRVGQGTLAAGLALVALVPGRAPTARRREALAWIVTGLAFAIFDAGGPLGLRYTSKWIVLTAFGLARLAGLGFEEVFVAHAKATLARRTFAALAIVLGLAALATVVLDDQVKEAMLAWQPKRVTVDTEIAAPGLAFLLARGALAAGCACGVLWARQLGNLSKRSAATLALALVLVELVSASKTEILSTSVPLISETPPLVELARAKRGGPKGAPVRLETETAVLDSFAIGDETLRRSDRLALDTVARLSPNLGHLWDVRLVESFDTVVSGVLTRLTKDERFLALDPVRRGALFDADLFLVNRSDLAHYAPHKEHLQILAEQNAGGRCLLIRNRLAPDYAYVLANARVVRDVDTCLQALLVEFTPPRERVLIGPEGVEGAPIAQPGASRVVVTRFEPEAIELSVQNDAPGWLVVRESFSPDWRCEIDGAPATIARADLLYRAVFVTPGDHTVRFTYAPWWWTPGLVLMLAGWTLLGLCGLKSIQRPQPPTNRA